MRLFLLPVSTRRTLLYAQRLGVTTKPSDTSYADRGAAWAAKKWAEWEAKDRGWQKKVVEYGNHAFRRIPYEEWGLKSVPPLSTRRRDEELHGKDKVQLVFPPSAISLHKAEGILRTLATERQNLHRQRLLWCCIGMPITIPFALVPVIPNLPFFYLLYRAWSHWRALAGGKHVQWLVENKLIAPSPSTELNQLYVRDSPAQEEVAGKEQLLLRQDDVQTLARTVDIPALQIEMERAIWQVEKALTADGKASGEPGQTKSSSSVDNKEKDQ
ncbi:protein (fungal and plant) [Paramyrothecium foliicola]|nr:protein (fungal and plant) [Paramyrothecium foliicola]